jgi:hypothetical protein
MNNFTVEQEKRLFLVSVMDHILFPEKGCGICEKPEGKEVIWFSPYSNCAHKKCFKLIEPSISDLIKTIEKLFGDAIHSCVQNAYHEANKAVRAACGSETIMSYFEKNGESALTNLFNTVGVEAVTKYNLTLKYWGSGLGCQKSLIFESNF